MLSVYICQMLFVKRMLINSGAHAFIRDAAFLNSDNALAYMGHQQ
jgi:hypothetical protein